MITAFTVLLVLLNSNRVVVLDLACAHERTFPERLSLRFAVLGAPLAVLAVRHQQYVQRVLESKGRSSE